MRAALTRQPQAVEHDDRPEPVSSARPSSDRIGATAGVPIWQFAALTLLIGLGGSLAVPTLTAVLVGSVPAERASTASGVLNINRQTGGALAVAIFGALVAQRETFVSGMQVSLVIAAVLLLATAAASLSLRSTQHGAAA